MVWTDIVQVVQIATPFVTLGLGAFGKVVFDKLNSADKENRESVKDAIKQLSTDDNEIRESLTTAIAALTKSDNENKEHIREVEKAFNEFKTNLPYKFTVKDDYLRAINAMEKTMEKLEQKLEHQFEKINLNVEQKFTDILKNIEQKFEKLNDSFTNHITADKEE